MCPNLSQFNQSTRSQEMYLNPILILLFALQQRPQNYIFHSSFHIKIAHVFLILLINYKARKTGLAIFLAS